jgi:hypothetical protein
MTLARLRLPEWIALAAATALTVLSFTGWYSGPRGGEITAWEAFTVLDLFLALPVLCGFALAATAATRVSPALPLACAVIGFVLGVLAILSLLVRFADQPGPDRMVEVAGGGWLGLASLILLTAALWASMRIETPAPVVDAHRAPVEPMPAPARVGVPPLSGLAPADLSAPVGPEPVGGPSAD